MPYPLDIPKKLIEEQLHDIESALTCLGCGRSTLFRAINAGTLASQRIGGGRFMRWADLRDYADRTGAVLQTGPLLRAIVLDGGGLSIGRLADELCVSAAVIEQAVNAGELVNGCDRRFDPRFCIEQISEWFEKLRAADETSHVRVCRVPSDAGDGLIV